MASPLFDEQDRLHADGPVPITELARRFLLPESTARYYCKRFLPWLPHAGEGKRRRFLPEAIPVFAAIVEGMQEHKDAKVVESLLGDPLPQSQAAVLSQLRSYDSATIPAVRVRDAQLMQPTAIHPHELGELAHAVRQQGAALEAIAGALTALQSQQQEVAALRDELAQSRSEAKTLREELHRLTVLQDSAEKTHQQDLEQLRKWLAALARQQQRESEEKE